MLLVFSCLAWHWDRRRSSPLVATLETRRARPPDPAARAQHLVLRQKYKPRRTEQDGFSLQTLLHSRFPMLSNAKLALPTGDGLIVLNTNIKDCRIVGLGRCDLYTDEWCLAM